MKTRNYVIAVCAIALSATIVVSCTKNENKPDGTLSTTTSAVATAPRGALGQSAFNLWGTCNGHPYNISGSNGICVPVGNCSKDVDAAQQNGGQTANGFQFYGCFKGGSNATAYAEEAVFVADDVTNWTGDEMGFVKTLTDNTLKAYIQGGGQYYTYVISSGDNGYHTFKAQARSSNTHMVDYYVDGNYKCTLTNNSGHYYNNYDYMVGTNHWAGGSNPTGQQIEMYNMVTY